MTFLNSISLEMIKKYDERAFYQISSGFMKSPHEIYFSSNFSSFSVLLIKGKLLKIFTNYKHVKNV